MARGFARKRGDIWYAYWRDPAGRQRSKAIGPKKKDAEAYLSFINNQLGQRVYREIEEITFARFAEIWLDDYVSIQVKPSTLNSYRAIVKKTSYQLSVT